MNHPLIFAIVLVSLPTMLAAQLSYGEAPAIADKAVDAMVHPYLDGGIVNAVSIGIVQGNKSRSRHYGQLSSQSPEKPTDQTVYEIGSMSKVFTGILLAHVGSTDRLADEGASRGQQGGGRFNPASTSGDPHIRSAPLAEQHETGAARSLRRL